MTREEAKRLYTEGKLVLQRERERQAVEQGSDTEQAAGGNTASDIDVDDSA